MPAPSRHLNHLRSYTQLHRVATSQRLVHCPPQPQARRIPPAQLPAQQQFTIGHRYRSRPFSTTTSMPSRYASAYAKPSGPGDARPTALDIVKDEGLEGKLSDKVVLITGCSSGIGIETARAMAATGAKVFCTARDMKKGEAALADILKPGQVELVKMDLNSLDSVRTAAKEILSKTQTLNILINNAGIMAVPDLVKTADGFESQFGTNHLSHFLLFSLLKPTLLASSSPQFNSRVVNLSSSGHRAGPVQIGNYNFERGNYSPYAAYGSSKTANIYMANEIERRYASQGLHGLSVMPGGIRSGLQEHVPDSVKASWDYDTEIKNYMKSPAQGATTSVFAALSSEWEGKGGRYMEDCVASPPLAPGAGATAAGYAPHAYNVKDAQKLWADSCKMVGVADDE
ncbi:MAG: hypothetical protein LQ344_006578 [Seirophora lacunosa]|nr:MAG: hypothetical protein LQ344_006578 [Seirophora lacunosa]